MRNRCFNHAAYRRNIRKALGRPLRDGESTAVNDGVFTVYGTYAVIGRVAVGEWEAFL